MAVRFLKRSAIAAMFLLAGSGGAHAAGEAIALPEQPWSFSGIFGTFDDAQLQRGLQVYLQVCSVCHGMKFLAYRNLADIGYSEDQIKAIAAQYEVTDGPDDEGEMFTRPAVPADRFVSPYPNDQAAAAANNGALPPDLSLMAKARAGGADYIYALLGLGYHDPPEDFALTEGLSYNAYFPGHQIAMAQPLYGDDVEYADGTPATIEQEARDVAAFLAWAAEPKMEERKEIGFRVVLYLLVLTAMFYAVKRKVWRNVH